MHFGRYHYKENYFKLGPLVQKMSFFYSSGAHFVRWIKTISAILDRMTALILWLVPDACFGWAQIELFFSSICGPFVRFFVLSFC